MNIGVYYVISNGLDFEQLMLFKVFLHIHKCGMYDLLKFGLIYVNVCKVDGYTFVDICDVGEYICVCARASLWI
jgi:hypothetical protein